MQRISVTVRRLTLRGNFILESSRSDYQGDINALTRVMNPLATVGRSDRILDRKVLTNQHSVFTVLAC
jgi:hypothetical protein